MPEVEDIPPVEVNKAKKTIKLGAKSYELIMCYLCPLDNIPLYAQWKLNGKPKASDNVIGRALRDSGFGSHRIFETPDGQGFEYDFEKDPRKKHAHEERPTYGYSRSYGAATQRYRPFLTLNPLFNVNDFIRYALGKEKAPDRITDDKIAERFIAAMKRQPKYFKVLEDICGHGRSLFYLNEIEFHNETDGFYSDREAKILELLTDWLGIDLPEPKKNPPKRATRPKSNPSPVQYADNPAHFTDPGPQRLISQIKHIRPSSQRSIFARARLLRQLQDATHLWSLTMEEVLSGQCDIMPRDNPAPVEKISEFPIDDKGPTLIIGGPGTGKSLQGWGLVEKTHKKYPKKPVAAVKFPESKRHLLPKWVTIFVDTIEQVPSGSIAIVDEAEDVCSKWDHKRDSPLARTLRLARQNNIILFYINQDTFIDKGAAMKVRNLIIKEVGPLQAGLERSGVAKYINRATDALRALPEKDVKKYSYIITPRGEGLIPSEKPSFWSEELSEAYATDPDEFMATTEMEPVLANPAIEGTIHSITYDCPGRDCNFGLCRGKRPFEVRYKHDWEKNPPLVHAGDGQTLIIGEVTVKDVGLKGINDAPRIHDSPHKSDGKARHVPMYLYTIGDLVQITLKGGQVLPFTDKYLVTGKDARYLFVVDPDIARLKYIAPEELRKTVKHGRHIVMFGSAWCPHSQKMRERLAAVSRSCPGITVSVVDADAAPALSKSLGLQDTPTTLFYADGALVGTVKGNKPIDVKLEEAFSTSMSKGGILCPA